MRAVVYEEFGRRPEVQVVDDPVPAERGAVIRVAASGLCRSDWHGWRGHDKDIRLPHVPGHELAGTIESLGANVVNWQPGARVVVPFVCACGNCTACAHGAHQVCERQTQPGFTQWGSFAEYVAIENVDVNLVGLPIDMEFSTAASLGCRFATAFRALVGQGRVSPGEWVAVHGCGGVGLSAVMIAVACGAPVVAVDISPHALDLAAAIGATVCVDASNTDVAEAIAHATGGGAHLSIDALGSPATAVASINCLRRHGRHIQVGLLPEDPTLPMSRVISFELTLYGSHGMAAHDYPPMLDMIGSGALRPELLVTRTIGLDEVPDALIAMGQAGTAGVTVVEPGRTGLTD
jgi:alcohol dehydrogenase